MTTYPITRPPDALRLLIDADRARASLAPPPDPNAWIAFLCRRCDRPFKVQGIARHCTRCISAAAALGVTGSEWIGEASGA
jgi:hypothetical protein